MSKPNNEDLTALVLRNLKNIHSIVAQGTYTISGDDAARLANEKATLEFLINQFEKDVYEVLQVTKQAEDNSGPEFEDGPEFDGYAERCGEAGYADSDGG